MVKVEGLYNTALCYTPVLENAAHAQIQSVCDQKEFADCKIRIMPDVHAGKGCTIGTTMTIRDKIVPGMVGVDIGCGMETVPDTLDKSPMAYKSMDEIVAQIGPTAEIVERIRPIYNFKAADYAKGGVSCGSIDSGKTSQT